jgi:uncharacterized protein with GYD domain
MPKFLFCGSYTAEGIGGLRRDGAVGEGAALEELVHSVGGKVEALYWAFGDEDLYLVADLPDNVAAGAVTLAVGERGDLLLRTVILETAEEVDAAFKRAPSMPGRPPAI